MFTPSNFILFLAMTIFISAIFKYINRKFSSLVEQQTAPINYYYLLLLLLFNAQHKIIWHLPRFKFITSEFFLVCFFQRNKFKLMRHLQWRTQASSLQTIEYYDDLNISKTATQILSVGSCEILIWKRK